MMMLVVMKDDDVIAEIFLDDGDDNHDHYDE